VDFEFALKLLTLPREVGLHPESGKPITAGLGRYGPFVQHEGKFANLDNFEEIFTVGLNRAVDVLASKQARGGRAGPAALRDLGPHPQGGGNLQVMSGRYGPYIKYDKVNATLPKDVAPRR
jgi:DNA topoisomerase I